ncbi:MAG TPA: HAMP domain-containing sensor histidine kinase [Actinomycetota bacterium]|jgi:signal transduction histidine kinase
MRDTLRAVATVVLVAAAGALAALAVGAAMGMSAGDLAHLVVPLAVSTVVTVAAALAANVALAKSPLRYRFLVVAALGAGVALANLAVMAQLMLVSRHDLTIVMLLVVFAAATAIALALVLASGSVRAVDRLVVGARRIGDGELDAPIGTLDAGPELDELAASLDEAAARLSLARARERNAEQMRRDLIVAVSHDLRTPLASMRAMVEAIDDGVVDDTATVRRYAGEMRRSVEQLVAMVDDLFELTQLDAGAIEVETERASLDDVVRSAVSAVASDARRKGLEVVTDLGGAPEATCSPRLVRVLQNLLVNAVRHTPQDGTVRVEAAVVERRLLVAVEDSGEGIAEGDLPRVFEPFFRADAARQGPGSGLGLALAQRIVQAIGGSIAVENVPASGARFEVELPTR